MAISVINARNQFKGQVKEIIRGDVLSEVDVQTPWGIVTSVITTRSVDELQLHAGVNVVALVKLTEMSIAKPIGHVAPDRIPNRSLAPGEMRGSSAVSDAANRLHAAFRNPVPASQSPETLPAFYRLRDVMRISALSRTTIYHRVAEGRFPAPVHLGGGRASGWSRTSLQQWIEDPEGYRAASPQPHPKVT